MCTNEYIMYTMINVNSNNIRNCVETVFYLLSWPAGRLLLTHHFNTARSRISGWMHKGPAVIGSPPQWMVSESKI